MAFTNGLVETKKIIIISFFFQTSSEPSRKGTNEIEYVDFKKEIIEEIDTFNERGRKQIIGGKLWKT